MTTFKSLILDQGLIKKIADGHALEVGSGIEASGNSLSIGRAGNPDNNTPGQEVYILGNASVNGTLGVTGAASLSSFSSSGNGSVGGTGSVG